MTLNVDLRSTSIAFVKATLPFAFDCMVFYVQHQGSDSGTAIKGASPSITYRNMHRLHYRHCPMRVLNSYIKLIFFISIYWILLQQKLHNVSDLIIQECLFHVNFMVVVVLAVWVLKWGTVKIQAWSSQNDQTWFKCMPRIKFYDNGRVYWSQELHEINCWFEVKM